MNQTAYVVHRHPASQPVLFRSRLPNLDIELTERCNNACLHCYINLPENDPKARQQELSTTEWQDILRQAADLGALSLRITGGEPLLREDFSEIYLFARRLGLVVQLFTNARLITPALADLWVQFPLRDKIEITVYGMHPETYDATVCAPGAYAEFQRGVELLLERDVPFTVKTVALPQNQADLEDFKAWAARLPGMDKSPGVTHRLLLRARRDAQARNRLIACLRLSPEEVLRQESRDPQAFRQEMSEFCGRFTGPHGPALFGCGAGQGGSVDAYGKFQPCMLLRHPELVYDLRQGSLQDALEHFFPRALDRRATNPAYLERCAKCFLHGLCDQCPAQSWMEHGTLDTPVEYWCQIAHAQAVYLGLLHAGEKAWQVEDWKERIAALQEEPSDGN